MTSAAEAVCASSFSPDPASRIRRLSGRTTVNVSTSQDTSQVAGSFLITASQVTAATVALSNPGAALSTSYTVTFSTGTGGNLTAGIDRISVEFPLGTTIPSSIAGNAVTINGLTSSLVTVSGSIVSIVAPANVPSASPVTVVFLESAGLKNPVGSGTYVVRVSTTKETSPVSSAGYAISALPRPPQLYLLHLRMAGWGTMSHDRPSRSSRLRQSMPARSSTTGSTTTSTLSTEACRCSASRGSTH